MASLEQLMDSTDFQILKIGLCEIKFEGGDLNNYTYHEIKNFSTNKDLNRKHVIQISTKSMDASFDLAETIGCENWKQNRMQLIISKSRKIWWQTINGRNDLLSKGIDRGLTNEEIIEVLALDSFVQSSKHVRARLIQSLKMDLNQKLDSLRAQ